ncbi:MAG: type II toxin-antitoxin system HicA family toxin [Deltaproteobacteria bacterium]|nr:type II toxin-antitoxin system HicA family toxin [Deltaproteobacteria bacterium]
MPPKIRELISRLERAGFVNRGGAGSHRNFVHPVAGTVTVSGALGSEAKRYHVREVEQKLREAKR